MMRGDMTRPNVTAHKRRLGKKAMACCRTIAAIERRTAPVRKQRRFSMPHIAWRPSRAHYVVLALVIGVGLAGFTGYSFWQEAQAKKRQQEHQARLERQAVANKKADECRRQKVASRSDQWGKATYDEIYDYSVCNYSAE